MNYKKTFQNRVQQFLSLILISGLMIAFQSCGDDDEPTPENEEELITTLTMTFSNVVETTDVVIAEYKDIDGDGGQPPIIINPTLKANAIYNVEIVVLNESVSPAEDITEEIIEEGTLHQFFFGSSNPSFLSFSYQDSDANGNPIGVSTRWEPLEEGTGTLEVILRHNLDKEATGVSDGAISNAGGSTDIEVSFDVVVE